MLTWVAALVLSAMQAQPPAAVPTGNAENGKRLFSTDYCYACHGTQGQGGKDGARIAPNPPNFASFRTYVRKPSGLMPAYGPAVLTDQEIADIYAFLKSIPPSKAAKAIPLLNR